MFIVFNIINNYRIYRPILWHAVVPSTQRLVADQYFLFKVYFTELQITPHVWKTSDFLNMERIVEYMTEGRADIREGSCPWE